MGIICALLVQNVALIAINICTNWDKEVYAYRLLIPFYLVELYPVVKATLFTFWLFTRCLVPLLSRTNPNLRQGVPR